MVMSSSLVMFGSAKVSMDNKDTHQPAEGPPGRVSVQQQYQAVDCFIHHDLQEGLNSQ